jgi:hypothetical protein
MRRSTEWFVSTAILWAFGLLLIRQGVLGIAFLLGSAMTFYYYIANYIAEKKARQPDSGSERSPPREPWGRLLKPERGLLRRHRPFLPVDPFGQGVGLQPSRPAGWASSAMGGERPRDGIRHSVS